MLVGGGDGTVGMLVVLQYHIIVHLYMYMVILIESMIMC